MREWTAIVMVGALVAGGCGGDDDSGGGDLAATQGAVIWVSALTGTCDGTVRRDALAVDIDGTRDATALLGQDVLDPGLYDIELYVNQFGCSATFESRNLLVESGDRHVIAARGPEGGEVVTYANLRGVYGSTAEELVVVHASDRLGAVSVTLSGPSGATGTGSVDRGGVTILAAPGAGATTVTLVDTATSEEVTGSSEFTFTDLDFAARVCVLRDSPDTTMTTLDCAQAGYTCGTEACRSRAF